MRGIWNKKLYLDTLKQLRVIGLVLLLITMLGTFLYTFLGNMGPLYLRDVYETLPLLELYMFIGPLLLCFKGFAFLFERSASDVFHALPVSRKGMYTSILAAILTWCLGTVLMTVLFGYGCMMVFGWLYNPAHLFYQLLAYGCGCLLVAAAAALGIAAAGTRGTAFIAAGLVLFLPRFMLVVASIVLTNTAPTLSVPDMGILFRYTLNFPVSLFINLGSDLSHSLWSMQFVGTSPAVERFLSPGTHVYTALLGLLYGVLGGIAFCKRPSEVAGSAMPGGVLQHVFRCALALPLLLAVCALGPLDMLRTTSGGRLLWLFVPLALLVYFLYELLTTRSAKRLLRALYVLPIPLVLAAAVTYGAKAYGRAEARRVPEAQEIEYVQVASYRGISNYGMLQGSEAQLRDSALLQMVADNLQYHAEEREEGVRQQEICLGIRLKSGKLLYRNMLAMPGDLGNMRQMVYESPALIEAEATFPQESEVLRYTLESSSSNKPEDGYAGWTEEQVAEFLRTFRQEYEASPVEARQAGMERYGYTAPATANAEEERLLRWQEEPANVRFSLKIQGSRRNWNFSKTYLVQAYTPQSANLVMQYEILANRATLAGIRQAAAEGNVESMELMVLLQSIPFGGRSWGSADMIVQADARGDADLPAAMAENAVQQRVEGTAASLELLLQNEGQPRVEAPFAWYRVSAGVRGEDGRLAYAYATGYVPMQEAAMLELIARMGYTSDGREEALAAVHAG